MEPRFVGRSAELDELMVRFEDALAGRPGVALVAGEPGIGKTRLVAEMGRIAGSRTVPVLWGTCTDEEGTPAFWPWRQILRSCLATAGPADTDRWLAGTGAELGRIAPELHTLDPPPPTSTFAGPEQRFALFDAMVTFVTRMAAPGGLVLVLDDVHWADPASTAVLVHLARHARDARLLLAITYRPRELGRDDARAAAVADLGRLAGASRLELRGLDQDAIAAALADLLGRPPSTAALASVSARSRGNPFFIGELGRALADPHTDADEVPGAVRDAVRRRLMRLPSGCRDLLDVAAVMGREVDPGLLAQVAGRTGDAMLDELDPALADGVLERPAGRTGIRFTHDLVREALLADLATARRSRIHQRVTATLAPRADDPLVTPELAYHALAALPLGDPAAAVAWAHRAARQAMTQLAHEEAATLYKHAVDVARRALPAPERADLLISAAHAHAAASGVQAATELCTEAAELARHLDDPALLGRAALVMPAVSDVSWLATSRQWCEEALRGMAGPDTPLEARLLAQLCHAIVSDADHTRLADVSSRALAMAERLGDRESLIHALRARQLARSGPDGNAERLALGSRMLELGESTGTVDAVLWGRLWRFDALLQAGRVVDAEVELDRLDPVVARLGLPLARFHLLRSRVALAFGRGRFADAAALNEETFRIATGSQQEGAALTAISLRFEMGTLTGDTRDGIAMLEPIAGRTTPYEALMRSQLALLYVAAGRFDDARRWFAALPPPGSPRTAPFMALAIECRRAELAADLGASEPAEECYRLLLPHADLHHVSGAGAVTTGGSVHLYLGSAAYAAGRFDAAVRHLTAAIAANDAAGLAPFAAMARFRLATVLRARARPADTDAASVHLTAAVAAAEGMGMAPLRARIAQLARSLRDGGVLSRRETEIAELIATGLTNRQAAAAAHISERTVESHVQHILAKLGFTTRTQIAAWAARRNQ